VYVWSVRTPIPRINQYDETVAFEANLSPLFPGCIQNDPVYHQHNIFIDLGVEINVEPHHRDSLPLLSNTPIGQHDNKVESFAFRSDFESFLSL
jgi:hypothetical protein